MSSWDGDGWKWNALRRRREQEELERSVAQRGELDDWLQRAMARSAALDAEKLRFMSRALADMIDAAGCAGAVRQRLLELEEVRRFGKGQAHKYRRVERAQEMSVVARALEREGRPLSVDDLIGEFSGMTRAALRTRLSYFYQWEWLDEVNERLKREYVLGTDEGWKALLKLPPREGPGKAEVRGDDMFRLHVEVQLLREEIAQLKAKATTSATREPDQDPKGRRAE